MMTGPDDTLDDLTPLPMGESVSTGDPLGESWEAAFTAANGRPPNDPDRQDRLFALLHWGSGPAGAWTPADWSDYQAQRAELWRGQVPWPAENQPAGLARFLLHLKRLSNAYQPAEADQFVRAAGLIWGGIAYGGWAGVQLFLAAAGRVWVQLHDGRAGWCGDYVDDDNPAHHWAGGFVSGYFFGTLGGILLNTGRDGLQIVTGLGGTLADMRLGNRAAIQGGWFRQRVRARGGREEPYQMLLARLAQELGSQTAR